MSRLLEKPGPVLLGLASIQRNGGFRSGSLRTYGGDSPKKLLVQPGELYVSLKDVTQSADLLGAVARLPIGYSPGRLTQDTVKLVPKHDDISIDYIYCLLRTPQYRNYCRAHATGTTNLGLPRDDFLAFAVPELTAIRQRIINIILALDDKIELNRRMNETLEAMARGLFKDWFVDFGPTRAKIEGRDSYLAPEIWDLFPDKLDEDGKPEGWTAVGVGEVVELLDSKRIPLSSREREKRRGLFPYHGATGVMDYVNDFLFDEILLLVGEDGSVARPNGRPFTQYVWGKIWVNNHAHVLRGVGVSVEQLKCFFDRVDIGPYVTGAVQPKLNQANLKRVQFPKASPKLHQSLDGIIQPWFARIRLNDDEAKILAQTRDLLLPKLMSGEVRVGDADKFAQEST